MEVKNITQAHLSPSSKVAMLHFPEVMHKAQAELDAVVGSDRMPEFEDKDSLPYINALVNETLRYGFHLLDISPY